MTTTRRIAALQFIQKNHRYEIDRLANSLGLLRSEMALLQTELDKLQAGLDDETYSVSAEAAPYLAGYLEAVKKQKTFYRLQMDILLAQIDNLEKKLFEKYCRAKTDESPLNRALLKDKFKRKQNESLISDEIGVNAYHRNQLKR